MANFPPPRRELHVHLRGAMPLAYFAAQLERHPAAELVAAAPDRHRALFNRLPHLEALANGRGEPAQLFEYHDFEGFLASYLFSSYFVRTLEDFRGLLAAVRNGFIEQGLEYVEVTVSVPEYLMHGVPLEGLCEALDEASEQPGVRLRWIVDLVRDFGPQAAESLLARLLSRPPRHWVGITLGGSEHKVPPAPFKACYQRARAAGLKLSVHAGEAAGPESVWEAIRTLEVDRIGHGVRAIEDPRLVEYLAQKGLPLEVCPSSNIRTGVYASFDDHPLVELHRAGVPLTINTDDPTFFATDLAGEFARAHNMGLTTEELAEIAENARRFAFDHDSWRSAPCSSR